MGRSFVQPRNANNPSLRSRLSTFLWGVRRASYHDVVRPNRVCGTCPFRRQRQIIHGKPSRSSNAELGSGTTGERLNDCRPIKERGNFGLSGLHASPPGVWKSKPRMSRIARIKIIRVIRGQKKSPPSTQGARLTPNTKLSDRRPTGTMGRKGHVRTPAQHRAENGGGGSSPASGSAIYGSWYKLENLRPTLSPTRSGGRPGHCEDKQTTNRSGNHR